MSEEDLAANPDKASPAPPLAGVRVLEFGSFVAAPTVARILGDFGAEVIKAEPPGSGDELRGWGTLLPAHDGPVSAWWLVTARNKRLITLDLRQPAGQALALRLVERCAIVIENFRPGRLEAWGLGEEQMRAVNSAVVLVRISGFGQTGPSRARAGYGNIAEAMGGLRHVTGYPDRPPVRVGVSLGDALAAQQAALGALLALRVAERTGQGQTVDVAITEAVYAMTEAMVTEHAHAGVVRERTGNTMPRAAPSNVYRTGDGHWLALGANGENVFRRLCAALGQPELAGDPRFRDNRARLAHLNELDVILGEWVGAHALAAAQAALDAAGVPAGPILSIADIAADPQFQARGMMAHIPDARMPGGEVVLPGVVPRLTVTPGVLHSAGGALGADNHAIYGGLLGLSDEEMAALAEQVVI